MFADELTHDHLGLLYLFVDLIYRQTKHLCFLFLRADEHLVAVPN